MICDYNGVYEGPAVHIHQTPTQLSIPPPGEASERGQIDSILSPPLPLILHPRELQIVTK